ncbi:hypothetical protein DB32_005580 [Sandaracinus amylolyticus]|uniref:Uncharacterized protein n=1 Tax=Sandaracinus amylolyticus TaxID=927083 RepID=A0A0F6W630_9BACT|nr:hypothetical protein DB32_005580 [Sandaracinus amylolyticus]
MQNWPVGHCTPAIPPHIAPPPAAPPPPPVGSPGGHSRTIQAQRPFASRAHAGPATVTPSAQGLFGICGRGPQALSSHESPPAC